MTTETILTTQEILHEHHGTDTDLDFARAIEQAVLHSPEIQVLNRDAELFRFIMEESWFQSAFERFDPDDKGTQAGFESECRRILGAAMEQQHD